jgi:hypothetical protein
MRGLKVLPIIAPRQYRSKCSAISHPPVSEEKPNDENDEEQSAKTPAYHRAPVIVTPAATGEQQHDQDNQD